jgi:hypothetical protein
MRQCVRQPAKIRNPLVVESRPSLLGQEIAGHDRDEDDVNGDERNEDCCRQPSKPIASPSQESACGEGQCRRTCEQPPPKPAELSDGFANVAPRALRRPNVLIAAEANETGAHDACDQQTEEEGH